MAAPLDPRRRTAVVTTAVTAVVWLVADLATKAWAWEHLRDKPRVPIIKSWFYLDFSFNTGSAFGFLRGVSFARPLFIAITVATLVYMAALVRKLPTRRLYGFVAIGCILGGALGNLHDRLIRQLDVRGTMTHGVVDFIQIFYMKNTPAWPNFNIADVALVVGVGLLIPFLLWHANPPDPPTPPAA